MKHFKNMSAALLAALPGLVGAPDVATQIARYHDRTGPQHEALASSLDGQGYRVVTMTVYGTLLNPRYAAVWEKRNGPATARFHGATTSEYQAFLSEHYPQGYVPVALSAMGSFSSPRFTGYFERTNEDCYIRHGLTLEDFNDEADTARDTGWRINTVDVYGSEAEPRYVVSFVRSNDSQAWTSPSSLSEYQARFSAFEEGWARPQMIGFNSSDRYVQVWTNESVGPWVARHDMTAAEYENHANTFGQQGMYPISLAASGSGFARRFAAVWATRHENLPKTFSATGQAVPSMAAFDTYVRNYMEANGTRAAAMAVAKDGRLVFARGYNLAESDYPTTQPTSIFRIASCTKPITGIAMHAAFEKMPQFIDSGRRVNDYLSDQNLPSEPAAQDLRYRSVTLRQLLTHSGGWNRSTSDIGDPMFKDEEIAEALGISMPITKRNVWEYMTQEEFLDFNPGNDAQYSNYGFSLLGQVLEQVNPGLSYEQIVQRDVLTPLGISRMRVRGSLKSQRLPGEVRYHLPHPKIDRSVHSENEPWVADQYGRWNQRNMDAHGAYVASAPDFVKILAAFDLGDDNPIMSAAEAQAMWSVPFPLDDEMDGWFLNEVDDGKGNTVELYRHGGSLPGTRAICGHRSDGYSFAFFTNGTNRTATSTLSVQISNLISATSDWPDHALFPSVGLTPLRDRITGTYSKIGIGCAVTRTGRVDHDGVNTPNVGASVGYRVANGGYRNFAYLMLGLRSRGTPLDAIGAAGCSLYLTPLASMLTITDNLGSRTMVMNIPNDSALVGSILRTQYAVLEPGANSLGVATSNALDTRIGGWR